MITADLKGADYERKLVWAYGKDSTSAPTTAPKPQKASVFSGLAGRRSSRTQVRSHNRWRCIGPSRVNVSREANAEALKLLNSGVDSLGFSIAKEGFTAEELDQLLAGISIPAINGLLRRADGAASPNW